MESLRNWLQKKNVRINHLFELVPDEPDYLRPDHPHYSPRLAMTIAAWKHASKNYDATVGAKTIAESWIRENAQSFGLANEDGSVSEQLYKGAARIANWDTDGGRKRKNIENNPEFEKPQTNSGGTGKGFELRPRKQVTPEKRDLSRDMDDEIPF